MDSITLIDIAVIIGVGLLVTGIGHRLGRGVGNRATFFNAGGSLPWWAVSASIIATVVSSVTFISVPTKVFQAGGNLGYIQVILGLMLGKVLTARVFANAYYQSQGVATTYDYIAARMDHRVGNVSMSLGLAISLINTAVKLLTTGLVLSVITQWPLEVCNLVIVLFSILWSWLAGLKTVIWTDFLLFITFALGAVFALIWTSLAIKMSLPQAFMLLDERAKLALFDLSVDPTVTYTLWAGIIGATTLSMAMAGSQATFQRVKACRSAREAQKAYSYSALFYIVHFVILGVGLAMSVFYYENPLPSEVQSNLVEQPDIIFPYFIISEVPVGLSGLFIAAIFAAGISTLDTALTEVSDISVTNIYEPYINPNASEQHYLWVAKIMLVGWGLLYYAISIFFSQFQAEGLLDLTFKLPNYLFGALLGVIVLARYRIGRFITFIPGFAAAMATVWAVNLAHIGFFWWCPLSALVMIITTCLIAKLRGEFSPEYSGIVNIK